MGKMGELDKKTNEMHEIVSSWFTPEGIAESERIDFKKTISELEAKLGKATDELAMYKEKDNQAYWSAETIKERIKSDLLRTIECL